MNLSTEKKIRTRISFCRESSHGDNKRPRARRGGVHGVTLQPPEEPKFPISYSCCSKISREKKPDGGDFYRLSQVCGAWNRTDYSASDQARVGYAFKRRKTYMSPKRDILLCVEKILSATTKTALVECLWPVKKFQNLGNIV